MSCAAGTVTPAEAGKRLGGWLVGFYLQDVRQVRRDADRRSRHIANRRVAFALAAYRGDRGAILKISASWRRTIWMQSR